MGADTEVSEFPAAVMFSTGKDNWMTPASVFDPLHVEFDFTLDVAADERSHKVERWLGPGSSIAEDALLVSWAGEICWMNPPYSRGQQERFIAKAALEAQENGTMTVALLPARTDTRTFHRYIWNETYHQPRPWVRSLRFVKGRIKFINPDGPLLRTPTLSVLEGRHAPNNSAPFPSMVVIFGSTSEAWTRG